MLFYKAAPIKPFQFFEISTGCFQLVLEEFFEGLFQKKKTFKNSSRPLAPKVLQGYLSRGKNSFQSTVRHLGRGENSCNSTLSHLGRG